MAVGPQGPVEYLANLALAADLTLNAVFWGSAHQTFSARSWQAKCAGKRWGAVSVAVVDTGAFLLTGKRDHCERACWREAVVLAGIVQVERAARLPVAA